MQVQIEQTETKGRAYIGELPKPLAEMTFTMAGPDKMIIDHTSVSDELRGKGAGRQLLMALVEKARNENLGILPLCPFARSVFQKDASIKDVWL